MVKNSKYNLYIVVETWFDESIWLQKTARERINWGYFLSHDSGPRSKNPSSKYRTEVSNHLLNDKHSRRIISHTISMTKMLLRCIWVGIT